MIREIDESIPEPLYPVSYSAVLDDHPTITTALDNLHAKRDLRDKEWAARRWSKHNLDSTVEEFIGMGAEKITLGVDGLAVKVLHERPNTHYSFDDQIDHLKRGEGVEGLEQLVTGNRQDGIIITEFMAGQAIATIPALRLARLITPKHIARLEETIGVIRERELDFDNVGNILFDPTEGFNFVDYRFITYKGKPIGSSKEPSDNDYDRKRQEEMSVETILHLAATMRHYTGKGIRNEYGELESGHGPRSLLGKLALKAAFSRFQK